MARKRFDHWTLRIWMPVSGLRDRNARPRGFTQASYSKLRASMESSYRNSSPLDTIPLRCPYTGEGLNHTINPGSEYRRLKAFIDFLAYRSIGNPKRLNELLSSFMVSADRIVPKRVARGKGFNCQDVLYLPDHKVMRIQLIARVYKHLQKGFEEKIRGRDDKTIVSLIYLSDFLFKFHDRAFSWESLELIDELVHMHRGHDLRVLLHELVEHYSGRYLHRIINGMYAYRFRSYFANEVEYLSRHSEDDMAAFNFTLDEAQTLRDHLQRLLELGDDRDKTDILSMLGELHEFYQEYEMARHYYRRCINARHPMLKDHVGEKVGKGDEEMSVLQAIYSNTAAGRKALLALQQWGPVTLRLFLKIVMTYELEHNYNEALIRYERCIKFAECIIQAFATRETDNSNKLDTWFAKRSIKEKPLSDNAYTLEYLGLLFEPLFAYAWLLEKNSYTSGNTLMVLKEGIGNFENVLKNVAAKERLNFVKAQWYKKVGAVCFYKGLAKEEERHFVNIAFEYYLKSANNLSDYFRKAVKTLFIAAEVQSLSEALLLNHYPSDYNLSVAECLGDLSESILAELCPIELFTESCTSITASLDKFEKKTIKLVRTLDEWFYNSQRTEDVSILDWLSKFYHPRQSKFERLNFMQKFDLALNLSIASSFYLLRAGYVESAAREVMHTSEIIAQYFNWYWLRFVTQGKIDHEWLGYSVIRNAMNKITWYSNYLPWLLRTIRFVSNRTTDKTAGQKPTDCYLMGNLIPSSALTSLCSIGLSLSLFLINGNYHSSDREKEIHGFICDLINTLQKWTGYERILIKGNPKPKLGWYGYFEKKLICSLQRHRYPVLNQLNALKTLADASLVRGYLLSDPNAIKNTWPWLQELYQINEKYNHPLHFTPMQSGLSLYLYWHVKENKHVLKFENFDDPNLHTEIRRLLVLSLDMCHMGRGYYDAIEKLYYLYDDFNDNQIHRNHAMQMAGAKLTNEALVKLRKAGFEDQGFG